MSVKLERKIDPALYRINDASQMHSPGYVVFKPLLEANLAEMIRIAGGPQNLRPHCKTHKMPDIIGRQRELGIVKHKCATIAEAEMLCEAGVDDILVAYQMVGPNIKRFVRLIDKFPERKFASIVDHPKPLEQLTQALEAGNQSAIVCLDVDSGMGRTGIAAGPSAETLYEMMVASPQIEIGGLHWYDGHHRQTDLDQRRTAIENAWLPLVELRDRLLMQGFPVPKIVVGGTGSFPVLAEMGEPDLELTPGTTTLFDVGYFHQFPDLNLVPAAAVSTRVVSCNRRGYLTLDCGHKSISPDIPAGQRAYFPELPEAQEIAHTEEHLVIACDQSDHYRPGDFLIALPRHVCPTSALHQHAYVVEDGELIDRWPIVARDRMLSI